MFKVYVLSMSVRYFMEVTIFLGLSIVFQYFIVIFNRELHILRDDLALLAHLKRTGASEEEIHHEEEIVHHEMHVAAIDLELAMFVALVSFAFPVR